MNASANAPRLVRNSSVPMMHCGNGSGLGFARVSSYSRISNPALLTGYSSAMSTAHTPYLASPVADGANFVAAAQAAAAEAAAADVAVVPEIAKPLSISNVASLPCSSPPKFVHQGRGHMRHRRSLRRLPTGSNFNHQNFNSAAPAINEDFSLPPSLPIKDPLSLMLNRLSTGGQPGPYSNDDELGDYENHDESCDPDEDDSDAAMNTNCVVLGNSGNLHAKKSSRSYIESFLRILLVVTPPRNPTPASLRAHASFIFVVALCYMCAFPALVYAVLVLPRSFILARGAAASLFIVPATAAITKSLPVTVSLFSVASLLFLILAAAYSGPVVLVWTSIVPLAAFTALSTRGVLVASAAAAAAVCTANPRDGNMSLHLSGLKLPQSILDTIAHVNISNIPATSGSPKSIIATWVLFLGLVGVVQSYIYMHLS